MEIPEALLQALHGSNDKHAFRNSGLIMRRAQNIRGQCDSTMFALFVCITQIIELVQSTTTDHPNTVPDGHAGCIQGAGTASALERGHAAAGFFGDKHNLKARLFTFFLIAMFFSVSTLIVLMRWGCWKKAEQENGKQQEELTTACPECQSHSTPADYPASSKISIPYATANRSDVFTVNIPTLLKESLNHFPSNLAIGVYTGFTTGVGPRR